MPGSLVIKISTSVETLSFIDIGNDKYRFVLFATWYILIVITVIFTLSEYTYRISDSENQNDDPQQSLAYMNLTSENPFHPSTRCAIFSWFYIKIHRSLGPKLDQIILARYTERHLTFCNYYLPRTYHGNRRLRAGKVSYLSLMIEWLRIIP